MSFGVGKIKIIKSIGIEQNQVIFFFVSIKIRLIQNNHSATHLLNHCIQSVVGTETDQKGSLVVPEKLRFDFSHKSALTTQQVAQIERKAQDVVNKNVKIYAKESKLAVAKSIRGLRSVFDEVYPDPVRVISFGVPVDQLEANPTDEAGEHTSVEFCGGTHVSTE